MQASASTATMHAATLHLHNAQALAELHTCCMCSCIGSLLSTPSRISMVNLGKHALLAPVRGGGG